jgi:hypothetical protein
VPSLSKVAMRCGSATKSGLPACVTRRTKSTIADFAAPSFQEGSASLAHAAAVVTNSRTSPTAK